MSAPTHSSHSGPNWPDSKVPPGQGATVVAGTNTRTDPQGSGPLTKIIPSSQLSLFGLQTPGLFRTPRAGRPDWATKRAKVGSHAILSVTTTIFPVRGDSALCTDVVHDGLEALLAFVEVFKVGLPQPDLCLGLRPFFSFLSFSFFLRFALLCFCFVPSSLPFCFSSLLFSSIWIWLPSLVGLRALLPSTQRKEQERSKAR